MRLGDLILQERVASRQHHMRTSGGTGDLCKNAHQNIDIADFLAWVNEKSVSKLCISVMLFFND